MPFFPAQVSLQTEVCYPSIAFWCKFLISHSFKKHKRSNCWYYDETMISWWLVQDDFWDVMYKSTAILRKTESNKDHVSIFYLLETGPATFQCCSMRFLQLLSIQSTVVQYKRIILPSLGGRLLIILNYQNVWHICKICVHMFSMLVKNC